MAVWNDLEPGHEPEFEAWYRRQHVPERLRVAGFREARRYAASEGSPRYCAFYWLDSAAVLATPQYRERLAAPTPWTQRMMARFHDMARTPCSIVLDAGAGLGSAMAFVASFGRGGEAQAASPALEQTFARCLAEPACVRLQLWQCDPAIAALDNPEARLRAGRDRLADWIVCIEAAEPHAASTYADAVAKQLRAEMPHAKLLRSPVYRLLWQMRAAEAPLPSTETQWSPGATP
jgi:hypothetical protein